MELFKLSYFALNRKYENRVLKNVLVLYQQVFFDSEGPHMYVIYTLEYINISELLLCLGMVPNQPAAIFSFLMYMISS